MDFTTLSFLVFLAAVAILYRFCPRRLRPALLLAASYAFYYAACGKFTILIFSATAGAYLAGRIIESARTPLIKRFAAVAFTLSLIALLVLFKSAPIFHAAFGNSLIIPLGISYYTFKLISYVADVYWGKFPAERRFIPFAAYAAFFPQIVAGPIQRSESFLAQIDNPTPPTSFMVLRGVQRILLGYFKKFVIADNLAILVNFIYTHLYSHGTPLLLGYYAYPAQMYTDFSALTDIAIGAALLLGIASPENFNAPFCAVCPSDYWRRWHITLTTWLTDYVFTPLRMATRQFGPAGLVFSLFVNMILIGVWHGFRWTFVLFGVVHAIYLSFDALSARYRKRFYKLHPAAGSFADWIGPVVTFHLVAIAFVFFRAPSVADTFYFLRHIAAGFAAPSAEFLQLIAISGSSILVGALAYLLLELAGYFRRLNRREHLFETLPRWGRWSVYSCTALAATFVIFLLLANGATRNPFLYAIF